MLAKLARSGIIATTIAVALLAFAGDARACSCAGPEPPLERLAAADAVFRGTVIEIDVPWALQVEADRDVGPGRRIVVELSDASVTAILEVQESWKGVHTREVELQLGNGLCCNCTLGAGFADIFGPGEELLIYAHEDEGKLYVGWCSFPVSLSEAGPHLELLGPGNRALAPGRTGGKPARAFVWVVAAVFALGLVLLLPLLRHRPQSSPNDSD